MRRPLRVCALSLGLIAGALAACDQILGNGDFAVDAADASSTPDATMTDAPATTSDGSSIPPDDASSDAGADADATTYPDAAHFPDGSVVWQPSVGGNGHGYVLVVVSSPIDWNAANAAAKALGGHLATVSSLAENQFLVALAVDGGGYTGDGPWLGATRAADAASPDAGWTWVTGEPWIFTNWEDGEPNNLGGDENYLEFVDDPALGEWNDIRLSGDDDVIAYLVELE